MTLDRLRRSSRVVALLLLASFSGLAHRGADDPCVGIVVEAHDESKHVVSGPDASAPEHCAICHAVRTPRSPFGPVATVRSPLAPGRIVVPVETNSHRSASLEQVPARAPPAPLT